MKEGRRGGKWRGEGGEEVREMEWGRRWRGEGGGEVREIER